MTAHANKTATRTVNTMRMGYRASERASTSGRPGSTAVTEEGFDRLWATELSAGLDADANGSTDTFTFRSLTQNPLTKTADATITARASDRVLVMCRG